MLIFYYKNYYLKNNINILFIIYHEIVNNFRFAFLFLNKKVEVLKKISL